MGFVLLLIAIAIIAVLVTYIMITWPEYGSWSPSDEYRTAPRKTIAYMDHPFGWIFGMGRYDPKELKDSKQAAIDKAA